MIVQSCLALLALCTLTAAADPDCEELVKPVGDRSLLPGNWILYAGTSNNKKSMAALSRITSSWIELSLTPDSRGITLGYRDKVDGTCYYGAVNCTLIGNSTQVKYPYNATHDHVGSYLVTCPDCLVWQGSVKDGTRDEKNLYILTKTGTLDASDFEVFKKQATCLNLQPDFHFGDSTDLCPDAPDAKGPEQ